MTESFIDFLNEHHNEDIRICIEPYFLTFTNDICITMRRKSAFVRRVLSSYELYLMSTEGPSATNRFRELLDRMYNEFDIENCVPRKESTGAH